MKLLHTAYCAATTVAAVPVAAVMLSRARGRKRLLDRFGLWNLSLDESLWFHGASMGEMNGIVPLMQAIGAAHPGIPILATSTSSTGLERAAAASDHQRMLPFDSPLYIRRAARAVHPKVFVFGETELWPALIEELAGIRVPMYLVNARISDYSYRHYLKLRPLVAPALAQLSGVFTWNQTSAERFEALGAPRERVKVLGNAKYDLNPPRLTGEDCAVVKGELFGHTEGPILVLGSIRPGEEVFWFPPVKAALDRGVKLRVVVAPRHKEKFEFFADALTKAGIPFSRRSVPVAEKTPVVLLDTMGELLKAYAVADAAFVGATLVDIGGHNPLEPAMFSAAVVLGPYTANVKDIVAELKASGGYVPVQSREDIELFLIKLCDGDPLLRESAMKAHAVWRAFSGATARLVSEVRF